MKVVTRTAVAVILALAVAASPAVAHHSFAMYDTAVEKTLTGKLIQFVIGANHSQYVMEVLKDDGTNVVDAKGEKMIWQIETTAASQLVARDITVKTFKYGTIFTISFSPLRDGRNGGAQRGPGLIMCGMKMPAGGCNEKTGKTF